MSKGGVQTLCREVRAGERVIVEEAGQMRIEVVTCEIGENGQVKNESSEISQSPPCRAVPRRAKIELDEEATFLLMKLKAKLGKNMSETQKVSPILLTLVRKLRQDT